VTSAGIGEVVVSWQQARSRSTSCRCFCLFSSAAAAIAVVSGSTSGSVVGQNKHMLVFAVASFALFPLRFVGGSACVPQSQARACAPAGQLRSGRRVETQRSDCRVDNYVCQSHTRPGWRSRHCVPPRCHYFHVNSCRHGTTHPRTRTARIAVLYSAGGLSTRCPSQMQMTPTLWLLL